MHTFYAKNYLFTIIFSSRLKLKMTPFVSEPTFHPKYKAGFSYKNHIYMGVWVGGGSHI
jgi:hypothetical protein